MMADSNTQQLLSPADYMRLVARAKYKLRAHEALIRQLMETGFNDYRIWRYLIDVAGIKVSPATAARFCKALRAASISAPPGEVTRLSTSVLRLQGIQRVARTEHGWKH